MRLKEFMIPILEEGGFCILDVNNSLALPEGSEPWGKVDIYVPEGVTELEYHYLNHQLSPVNQADMYLDSLKLLSQLQNFTCYFANGTILEASGDKMNQLKEFRKKIREHLLDRSIVILLKMLEDEKYIAFSQ